MALGNTFRYDMISPSKQYNTLEFRKAGDQNVWSPYMPGTENAADISVFNPVFAPESLQVGADTLSKQQFTDKAGSRWGYGMPAATAATTPINDVPPILTTGTGAETSTEKASPVVPKQEYTQPFAQKSAVNIPHYEPPNVSLPVIDVGSFDSGLTNTINQRATQGFQYTPEQLAMFLDPMERQNDISAKETMDDFLETMNRAGILESTVTTDYGGRLMRNMERERQDAYSQLAGQLIPFQEEANASRIGQATARESDIQNLAATKSQLEMQRAQLMNDISRGNYETGLQAAQMQMQVDSLNSQIDQANSQLELSRGGEYRNDAYLQLAVDELGLNRSKMEDEIKRMGQSQEFGQGIEKIQTLLSLWDRQYGQYMDESERELEANKLIEQWIQQLMGGA